MAKIFEKILIRMSRPDPDLFGQTGTIIIKNDKKTESSKNQDRQLPVTNI